MSNQSYDNTNRVSAWKNMDKQTDTAADYTGTLNVDGQEFFLDLWIKEISQGARAGQKMLSGKVKAKQKQGGGGQQQRGGSQQNNRRNQDADDF